MKPWSDEALDGYNEEEISEDEYEQLWKDTIPSDYLVALINGYLIITPEEYFRQDGCCYDQHLDIGHLLPEYLAGNEMEGKWRVGRRSDDEVKEDLRNRGFIVDDEAFIAFIEEVEVE